MSSSGRRASRTEALRARDRGLRRVSLATRSLVAVSVGAVGFFSAIAARAQSGTTSAVRRTSGTARSVVPTPNTQAAPTPRFDQPSSDAPAATLAPPPAPPTAGYQYDPAPVVSGAT